MHPPRVLAVTLLASILTVSLAGNFNNTAIPQPSTGDASSRLRMKVDATTNKDDEEKMISFFEVKRFVKSMMGLPKDIKTNYLNKNANPTVVYEDLVENTLNDVDNILASSRVQIVEMYIHEYNKLNPIEKKDLVDVLGDVYGDKDTVTVILKAMADTKTKKLATRVQGMLFQHWLIDEEKTVPNLLELLDLGNIATFDCKRLKLLLDYVDVLARRHSDGKFEPKDLIFLVTTNEHELVRIIANMPNSGDAEKVLFRSWLDNKFPGPDVIRQFSKRFYTNDSINRMLNRYQALAHKKLKTTDKKNTQPSGANLP